MRIQVHVISRASKDEIVRQSQGGVFTVKIRQPAINGLANEKLISFLAKVTGVTKSKVRIIRGEKSRNKLIDIDGSESDIMQHLKGNNEEYL